MKKRVRALYAADTQTSGNPTVVGIDVSEDLMTLAPSISPMLSLYLQNGRGKVATQTKHEWFDDVILPKSFTVGSVSGNDVTFSGSTAPIVNYILNFTTSAGVHVNATAKVTAVAGQVATVSMITGVIGTVVTGLTANVISEGVAEGRQYVGGTFHKGPRTDNFTEIFDEGYEMSGTLGAITALGGMNDESVQAMASLKRLAQKMTKAFTFGVKHETGSVRGLGGIDYFLASQSGANTLAVTGNPTAEHFDTMVNAILNKTGETGTLYIVCHGKWAPVIKGFNARTMGITDTTVGGTVKEYISSTGQVLQVQFDNTRPQNKIYFEDVSRIAAVALNGRQAQFDEYQKNRDGVYRPLTGEYTLEVRNAKEAHGTIIIS